jgi:acyl-coenzyme A synthetase/AMP-(fatty) acid ligase
MIRQNELIGALADGELLVTGRLDDLLCIGGRKVFAWEMENVACSIPHVREGNCAVVADGGGQYVALFEARDVASADLESVLAAVRRKLSSFAGIGPSAVGCLPRGTLPKTPSGKMQRNRIMATLRELSESCLAYAEF